MPQFPPSCFCCYSHTLPALDLGPGTHPAGTKEVWRLGGPRRPPKCGCCPASSDTTGLSSFHARWAGGGVTSDLLGGAQGKEACERPALQSSCAFHASACPYGSAHHQHAVGTKLTAL